jgi:hypothetical protein
LGVESVTWRTADDGSVHPAADRAAEATVLRNRSGLGGAVGAVKRGRTRRSAVRSAAKVTGEVVDLEVVGKLWRSAWRDKRRRSENSEGLVSDLLKRDVGSELAVAAADQTRDVSGASESK